jgi:hypothetical protein
MTQNGIEGELGSLSISSPSNLHVEPAESHEVKSQALDLQQRAKLLLEELVQFELYLKERKRESTVYLNAFKSDVQNELKLLEKV